MQPIQIPNNYGYNVEKAKRLEGKVSFLLRQMGFDKGSSSGYSYLLYEMFSSS
jgi:hypothetical protein